VEEFRSAAAARDAFLTLTRLFRAFLKKQPGITYRTFPVSEIPTAFGLHDARTSLHYPSGADNILFAEGPFFYLVGDDWAGFFGIPPRAHLLAAAMKLYIRVRGHPAG
jgi:hypothetical protein